MERVFSVRKCLSAAEDGEEEDEKDDEDKEEAR